MQEIECKQLRPWLGLSRGASDRPLNQACLLLSLSPNLLETWGPGPSLAHGMTAWHLSRSQAPFSPFENRWQELCGHFH